MKINNENRTRHITIIATLAVWLLIEPTLSAEAGGSSCDGIPSITMRFPGHGASQKQFEYNDEVETITIGCDDMVRFHGHQCAGSSLGYRACQVAFAHLYPGEIPPRGDQFVVNGAIRACPTDAVSFVTGARYGKGSDGILNSNMAFDKRLAKPMSFIFASMASGKAVKLVSRFEWPKELEELKAKASAGDPDARLQLDQLSQRLNRRILLAPEQDIFDVHPLTDFSWADYKEKYMK